MRLWWWAGVLTLVATWWFIAQGQPDFILPGPHTTLDALIVLICDGSLGQALSSTLLRAATGLGLACIIGLSWGTLAGLSSSVNAFTASWLQTLMSAPPIVIVVITMLWFGPTSAVVVSVVALVTLPLIAIAMRDAIGIVDRDLLEMGAVLGLTFCQRLVHIIIPTVLPPVISAISVALGQSIRLTVMAELLATTTGVGAAVQRARTNLDTDQVFALSIAMAVLTLLLEALILSPIRSRAQRVMTPLEAS